ncbi:MAG: hypothetical protein QM759_13365 [Terricaulis sp.]
MKHIALLILSAALAACGPQIGSLQKGETGRVVRVYNGDTLLLDSGLRVFLAEVDAPRGKQAYANQSRAELEALALNRTVLLAYGGTRRWERPPSTSAPDTTTSVASTATTTVTTATTTRAEPTGPLTGQTAIAHVFVETEGGRWFWLQHALVGKGAVIVRPRSDNHARTMQLLDVEAQARAAKRGLWNQRDGRVLTAETATRAARSYNKACMSGQAPYRVLEGTVHEGQASDTRATLVIDGGTAGSPFSVVVFGDNFAHWDGPVLAGLTGARIRARGGLGVMDDAPELCLENGAELQVLRVH